MDNKEKYLKAVEDAKAILKVDKQLRKQVGRADYLVEIRAKARASARDVGIHKHTSKLEDKKRYKDDLLLFLQEVFPEKFWRPFSPDHIKFIRDIERVIKSGGQYAVAMPRSSGKSTIIAQSVLWAILFGYRKFIVTICADRKPADRFIKGIKSTLTTDRIAELFPEVAHYAKALKGVSQRAATQTSNGVPTYIGWNAGQINFPWVDMDPSHLELCKGAIITAGGITAGIRGLLETLPDGTPVRPDMLFIDDPSTRESASSPSQCRDREILIKNDLLPLAGIGTEIAALLSCTCIEMNDLADQFLGEWQSTRAKALYKFPDEHEGLWAQYIDLYRLSQKRGEQEAECNAFYLANRARMDAGSIVADPHRMNKGEISALQNVYNFIAKNGLASFYSELQNEPKESTSSIYNLNVPVICSRLNHLPRYVVPPETNFLVVYGDVNYIGINYVVLAATNSFTSYVIDYGKFPEGKRERLIEESEEETSSGAQKISKGILGFVGHIYKKHYIKNGKRVMPQRILLDGNFMSQSCHGAVLALQRSKYPILIDRGRSNKQYKPARQDKIIGQAGNQLHVQHGNYGTECVHNSDYWKMVCQKAFLLPAGVPGSLSIWGNDPREHEEFAEEIISEKLTKYDSAQNYYEFHKNPLSRNDKLDCLSGSYVAASICGAVLSGGERSWRPRKVRREVRKPTVRIEE